MRTLSFALLLLFSVCAVKAQQQIIKQSVIVSGIVRDGATVEALQGVRVLRNNSASSLTGADGSFIVNALSSDTLVFKALGYKDAILILRDTLRGDHFIAGIYMKSDTIAIGEVIIIPRFRSLKSEILSAPGRDADIKNNARYNVAVSAYQGRTTIGNLGDPASNYELLRNRQRTEAYTAGQLGPDQMVSISPLILIPAAYLLVKGLPEKPPQYSPQLSDEELRSIEQEYFRQLRLKSK